MSTFTWKPIATKNANFHDKFRNVNFQPRDELNMTTNLVDAEWEVLDPTPDIHSMFLRFDDRFFSSKLRCVELEWSKRMYSCAGICYSRRNAMGSSITIRLSEPLLKLRPRKDLVQTLLHEMIHAFSFIRGIREGNGGHGPFFQKMMNEINKIAGTDITVYHTFHDEVNVYKKHVWRCNGICSNRKPFFGYVRRVANRAPGPNDLWWSAHQKDCGGYFEKVGEPDKVAKAKKTSAAAKKAVPDKNQPKISDVFGGRSTSTPSATTPTIASTIPPPSARPTAPPGSNIRGFSDFNQAGGGHTKSPPTSKSSSITLFNGPGNLLSKVDREIEQFKSIQEQVRNSWQKRYGGTMPDSTNASLAKKLKTKDPVHLHQWQVLDPDIAIRTPYVETIDLLDSDNETEDDDQLKDHNDKLTQMANKTVDERKSLIRQELYESEDEGDEIEMIDDEFDDAQAGGGSGGRGIGGKSSNVLLAYSDDEVVKCPICEGGVSRGYLSQHMEEGCLGITRKVAFVFNKNDPDVAGPSTSFSNSAASSSSLLVASPQRSEAAREEARYPCPNCGMRYGESKINEHLDECLN